MVGAGVLVHPFTLKLVAGRFHYADRVVTADVIFVPRIEEDKNGEVYTEAFREYWAGNGKAILVEEDRVFGFTMKDVVGRMAKERGIKEEVVRNVQLEGDEAAKAGKAKEIFAKQGIKKVLVVVPDYASRRFRLLYGSEKSEEKVVFLVRPVSVSYFKADKWWRTDISRNALLGELYKIVLLYVDRFKYGGKETTGKE
jgi:hypothetical protein